MDERSQKIIGDLEPLMTRLRESPVLDRGKTMGWPEEGVYVFYENGKPRYIGRSNSVRNRVRQHSSPSAKAAQAPFAVRLLREKLNEPGGHRARYNGKQLAEKYVQEFQEQLERISKMDVRAVEITDQPTQGIFEIYASVALGTDVDAGGYNDFRTS